MSVLGKRLKYLRDKNNYSQKRVAESIGISNVQLSRYESGDRNPDPELIAKFAEFYEVTTDYLLGLTDSIYRTKKQDDFIKATGAMTIQEIKENYRITYDDKEVTDEELQGMLAWIKANRMISDDNKKK